MPEKQLKIEDTNIAKIGSDEDLKQRIAAAKNEKAWEGVGEKEEMRVWRIEKFQVVPWKDVGSFYDGDSYIIYKAYKPKPDAKKLAYDIHFWLGVDSSLDEMGTAAYKTVELDDLLNTLPVQHREVMGCESDLFLSYFPKGINIMKGGIESGFNHVKPTEYKPKLLQVKGKKLIRVFEVPVAVDSLNEGDVFVLDAGLKVYQWSGRAASRAERYTAMTVSKAIQSDRGGKPAIIELDKDNDGEGEDAEAYWKQMGVENGKRPEVKSQEEGGDDSKVNEKPPNKLYQISDESGKMEFKKVGEGSLKKGDLKSEDVFLADVGDEVYIWVGKGASKQERSTAMFTAMNYLKSENRPLGTPITRVIEEHEPAYFNRYFS
mmetsp:Transcript_3436/g.5063  ORF Transcript_3436/g.5063 Transcript_3436/m.5063 type:complete len:375 (+) Transcript_3436:30-1154(+)